MFALGLLPLTIVANDAPTLIAVTVYADPHSVETERLMRKAGDDQHVKAILAYDGQLKDIHPAETMEPLVNASRQELGASQQHIWHDRALHQEMASAIQPAGRSLPSIEASATGSRQASVLERILSSFKSFLKLRSRGDSRDALHRGVNEGRGMSNENQIGTGRAQEERRDDSEKSSIYLFRDADCTESALGGNFTLPRFHLPKDSQFHDGRCVEVNQTNSSRRSENLRISCTSDGAEILVIYGQDCKGGIDDKFKMSFDSDDAELFGRGDCVRAVNMDVYQLMYAQLTIQDGDNIGLPGCVFTWKNLCLKHMLKVVIVMNVLFAIAFIVAAILWWKQRQHKKLQKKLKASSKQSAEQEGVDKPNEDKK